MKPMTLAVLFALVTFAVIAVDAAPAPEAAAEPGPAPNERDDIRAEVKAAVKTAVRGVLVKHMPKKSA